MTLKEIVDNLGLSVCDPGMQLDQEITGGYTSDLLSDVIANSRCGNVWVTMQVHVNIVAVAVLKELSAIILVNGRTPSEDTLRRAIEEKVIILTSRKPAFETTGELYEMGIQRTT
jgi:hypothetical protein